MKVVVVTGEPIWPAHTGGRARLAGLVGALREAFDVEVFEAHDGVPGWRQPLSFDPRLGRSVLRHRTFDADVVLVGHSYLGAMVRAPRLVVDFANIEAERYALLARDASPVWRAVHRWEAWKARRWEPALARRAWLNVAVSDADAATIRGWGGDVVTVPSGRPDWIVPAPSPEGGPALLVCNGTYPPNQVAADWVVSEVWPQVRARHPGAELRLVGRATERLGLAGEGVTVVGEVDDLGAEYARAAFVVAPVTTGGGTQLKVAEALAAGRAVVATRYSARSVPNGMEGACLVADEPGFADAVVRMFRERGAYEIVALSNPMPTWAEVAAPLVSRLRVAA